MCSADSEHESSVEAFRPEIPTSSIKPTIRKRRPTLKEQRQAAVVQEQLRDAIIPEDIVPDPRDDESCSSHLRGNVDV